MKNLIYLLIVLGFTASSGCGGSSSSSYGSGTGTTISGIATTELASSGGGSPFLTGVNGRTLYTAASCTGGCLSNWPPATASVIPTAGSGVTSANIGLTPSGQVTYNSQPLYYFYLDTVAGETTGNGEAGFTEVTP